MTKKRGNGEGSIFPYRNKFAAYVRVTRPDGTKAKKWVYGKDRDEVHKKWLELHRKAGEGPVATKTPTLGNFMSYWLKEVVEPHLAPKTFDNYERFNRLYITPGLGKKKLDKLTVRECQTWLNKVAAACQCCAQGRDAKRDGKKRRCCAKEIPACCESQLSKRAVRDVRDCFRSALSHAVDSELIGRNIGALLKVGKVRRRKGNAWSTDEARQFLESARQADDPLYAAYVLILVLGLRKGEVLGLVEGDVNLETAELTPGLQLQRVGGKLLHRDTKTEESDSTLPLPGICITALGVRLEQKKAARVAAGDAWTGSEFIITTRFGTPVEPRNFNRSWDARCAKAGVRKITVHDARRTCGSLLVDLNVHPRVVMQVLRHADFKISMEIYSKVSSKQTREALKKLSESLD